MMALHEIGRARFISDALLSDVSLDDIIKKDAEELAQIGGSFEAIGKRMLELCLKSKEMQEIYNEYCREIEKEARKRCGYEALDELDGQWNQPETPLGKVYAERQLLFDEKLPVLPMESEIALKRINNFYLGGIIGCDFSECTSFRFHRTAVDYMIKNIRTGATMLINELSAHIAGEHHLLQKGNEFATSPIAFYTHFMKNSYSAGN